MLCTIASTLLLSAAASPGELSFYDGPFANAFGEAERQEKDLVAVYFWRNGSEHCASMWQHTLQHPNVVQALSEAAVLVSADYDDAAGGKLFARFNVSTLPTIVFLSSDGAPEDAVNGFIDAEGLQGELARIRRGEGTVSGLRAAAAAAQGDEAIELTWKLAGKVHDLGLTDEHDAVLASIREMDPRAKTVIGARAHLWHVRDGLLREMKCSCEGECVEGACDGPERSALVDLDPIYDHAKRMRLPEARFEAWGAVANLEGYRENCEAACKAYERAAKDLPEASAVSWPKDVAWWAIERAKEHEVSAREKRLALEMAELSVKGAKKLNPAGESYAAAYGDVDPRHVQAEALVTLAFALEVNGKQKQALEVARDVLAVVDSEDYRELLAPILAREEG